MQAPDLVSHRSVVRGGSGVSLPVHVGGTLAVETRADARRVRLRLDCGQRKLRSDGRRRWVFEVDPQKSPITTGRRCTSARLEVAYRSRDGSRRPPAIYTFALQEHVHPEACTPEDTQLVVENESTTVLSATEELGGSDGPGTAFYSCRRDTGRSRRLGWEWSDGFNSLHLEQVRLAGDHIAYVQRRVDERHDQSEVRLLVRDTATWEVRRFIQGLHPNEGRTLIEITDVELSPAGAVGWISWTRETWPTLAYRYEVRKADSSGWNVVLDRDKEIGPRSLTLVGSLLEWTHGEERRSATLE